MLNRRADETLETNARFSLAYDDFIKEYGYDAIAVSCWPKFQDEFQYSVCAVVGGLNDKGIPTACEGDLTSAISMLLLKYLSDDVGMLMDMGAFDQADDTVLMCTAAPPPAGSAGRTATGSASTTTAWRTRRARKSPTAAA